MNDKEIQKDRLIGDLMAIVDRLQFEAPGVAGAISAALLVIEKYCPATMSTDDFKEGNDTLRARMLKRSEFQA